MLLTVEMAFGIWDCIFELFMMPSYPSMHVFVTGLVLLMRRL